MKGERFSLVINCMNAKIFLVYFMFCHFKKYVIYIVDIWKIVIINIIK